MPASIPRKNGRNLLIEEIIQKAVTEYFKMLIDITQEAKPLCQLF